MTVVLRRVEAPTAADLDAVGTVLVGLAEVVGCFGSGPIVRVVLLGDWL